MKYTKFAAAIGVAALALSACGGSDDSSDGATDSTNPPAEQIDYLACIVSDAGGWDDKSFNQSAKEGLDRAENDLGVQVKTAESKDSSDFEDNVQAMVTAGCDLTIGVGFMLTESVEGAATDNEDLNFALVDATFEEPTGNERALVFNTQEAAYLAGYAAAAMTETGKVATFGGVPIPSVTIFMDGYVDGVAKYNEDNDGDVEVIGWDKDKQSGQFTNDFDDQTKGTQVAQQLIQQGADIIMPVAGPVGLGAAAAAQADGSTYIIGVDSDWYESAADYKDIVITSVQKDINNAVFDTIQTGAEGNWDGTNYVGTLENGGVGLAPFHDFEDQLPEGLTDELDQLEQDIIDGTIVVESEAAFEVE
ncbi:BMP family lipoprotein [Ancrocorticia populi]|uniref:BMP family lipoprotein n=1 Tax=Ancrocorticia populi TaxID=2175228 RepID=UPI00235479D7|nr:BMP family ABC transporter substrate-binding protein [Ancrocorticia populi]